MEGQLNMRIMRMNHHCDRMSVRRHVGLLWLLSLFQILLFVLLTSSLCNFQSSSLLDSMFHPVIAIEIVPITVRGGGGNDNIVTSNNNDHRNKNEQPRQPRNNKNNKNWFNRNQKQHQQQMPQQQSLDELIAAAAVAVSETTAAAVTSTVSSMTSSSTNGGTMSETTSTTGGKTSTNKIQQKIRQLVEERTRKARGGAFAVAGSFSSIYNRIMNNPDWNFKTLRIAIGKALDVADIVALTVIGWCTEPIARYYYYTRYRNHHKNEPEFDIQLTYEDSWLYKTVNVIQELGRLGSIVYIIDILSVIVRKMGFTISSVLNERIGQTILTLWCASRIRRLKQIWFLKMMKLHPEGRAAILSRIVDGVMVVIVLFFMHDIFKVTIGTGLQSIAAVTGLSTVIFSLAAKDFAQMLLAGIAIYNSDKFYEGEKVTFGDKTSGTIMHQGYFELHILGSDGIITRIPNGQIINQRVQNLSRTHTSTIRQILKFQYENLKSMPLLLKDIENEIIIACPKLINDGTRTFRAIWTDYKDDHLEVVVEASFNIPPTAEEYHTNKQSMLQAIANAVEKNHVEFALPTSLCLSEDKVKK